MYLGTTSRFAWPRAAAGTRDYHEPGNKSPWVRFLFPLQELNAPANDDLCAIRRRRATRHRVNHRRSDESRHRHAIRRPIRRGNHHRVESRSIDAYSIAGVRNCPRSLHHVKRTMAVKNLGSQETAAHLGPEG